MRGLTAWARVASGSAMVPGLPSMPFGATYQSRAWIGAAAVMAATSAATNACRGSTMDATSTRSFNGSASGPDDDVTTITSGAS